MHVSASARAKTNETRAISTKQLYRRQVTSTLPTRHVGPRGVLNVEADKVLKVQEDRVKGVELVGEPEVCKAHVEERRAKDAT